MRAIAEGIDEAALIARTTELGFVDIIDAFHIMRGGEQNAHRFFIDDCDTRRGITLTDERLELARGGQHAVLPTGHSYCSFANDHFELLGTWLAS